MDKVYPNSRKQAIRNKAMGFIIKDGELFHKKKPKEKVETIGVVVN